MATFSQANDLLVSFLAMAFFCRLSRTSMDLFEVPMCREKYQFD